MTDSFDFIRSECEKQGISLPNSAKEQLKTYMGLLIDWNSRMNLTAITEPREIYLKHFYDCLLFFKYSNPKENATLIDVGTGAGFPGVVLKIARPDLQITLLDSLQKRLTFLDAVKTELGLSFTLVHSRAEDGGRKPELREQFDIATARAVARLNVLSEYCLPYVKPGGQFVSMKGPAAFEEAEEAAAAVKKLGGEPFTVFKEILPERFVRCFCITKKISQTPTVFPRIPAKIAKKPL